MAGIIYIFIKKNSARNYKGQAGKEKHNCKKEAALGPARSGHWLFSDHLLLLWVV
jgi:hypothetical protein